MNALLNESDSYCVAQAAIGYINGGVARITEQLRPKVCPDGDQWCCLYGEDIQSGICGFGDTPGAAVADWETNFYHQRLTIRKEAQP